MTEQLKLPWKSVANSWQYTTIYNADGNHICRLDLEDWGVTEDNQDALEKVRANVAALIVQAVNSYPEMRKALAHFIEAFDNGAVQLSSPEIDLGDGEQPHPWHEEWISRARKALATDREVKE